MKKPILIIGKPRSGKSFLVNSISLLCENVFWLNERNTYSFTRSFLLHGVTKETDYIIIEDVSTSEVLRTVMRLFLNKKKIKFDRQCQLPLTISVPKIIITTNVMNLGEPILSQFKVITTEIGENGIFNFKKLNY